MYKDCFLGRRIDAYQVVENDGIYMLLNVAWQKESSVHKSWQGIENIHQFWYC